jgi:hypothetical protein
LASVVEDENPDPEPAIWQQGENVCPIEIIEARSGWLICRQPDSLLCGVIWSDGNYYADILVDGADRPARALKQGLHVRNTVQFNRDDADDLGAIIV